jgi:hypothetical protein
MSACVCESVKINLLNKQFSSWVSGLREVEHENVCSMHEIAFTRQEQMCQLQLEVEFLEQQQQQHALMTGCSQILEIPSLTRDERCLSVCEVWIGFVLCGATYCLHLPSSHQSLTVSQI